MSVGNKELSWLGRQLQGITEGESTVSYTYNGDGQRTSKTVNGVNTEYIYNGEILAGQKTGNDIIVFMYDNNSDAFGFIYNSTEYYYVKNAQNDVTAIADSNGNVLARYYYDAWGKVLEITGNTEIAGLNPIRYRSYYYDVETGWYYLNTRYYSADMCRFINEDSQLNTATGTLGFNLFAYCNNNSVKHSDHNGHLPILAITATIGAVAGAIAGGIIAAKYGKNVWAGIGIGAVVGGLAGAGLGAAAGVMLAGSATASTAAVVSGAGMLATAVSTGGAGTGLALVADNISRAVNNVGTVLYSGGEQARQAATTFAINTRGTIIDSTVIGQVANTATKAHGADFTTVWSQASATFCHQASGVVNAFVSNSAYRGVDSIFWSVEMPTLLNNPRVTEIIIHIFE